MPATSILVLYHLVLNSAPAILIVSVPSSTTPSGFFFSIVSFLTSFGNSMILGTSRFIGGALNSMPLNFDTTATSTTCLSVPVSTSVVVIVLSVFMPPASVLALSVTLGPFLNLDQLANSGL